MNLTARADLQACGLLFQNYSTSSFVNGLYVNSMFFSYLSTLMHDCPRYRSTLTFWFSLVWSVRDWLLAAENVILFCLLTFSLFIYTRA